MASRVYEYALGVEYGVDIPLARGLYLFIHVVFSNSTLFNFRSGRSFCLYWNCAHKLVGTPVCLEPTDSTLSTPSRSQTVANSRQLVQHPKRQASLARVLGMGVNLRYVALVFGQSSRLMSSIELGDIIFLRGLRESTIVICSTEAALDLMEKRSAIYSDKPAYIIDQM